MADVASLVLACDSSQVARGTAALDGLTAAGARAEAAAVGLGVSSKGAAAEATAMAAAAQASARAVMGQAAGFGAATEAARLNTLAMRETLVVARELARGNFTRIPGSLSLLAQGIGSQGGIGAFLSAISQQIGLVKTLQNAELAEAAAAAASAAAGVEAAARKAAAAVMAADTEVALAEAQVRVTEGTTAEAAAQVRLAAAHDGVAAAAAEAAVAEEALATAMGRSAEAGAASAAATRTVIGGTGVGLIGLGLVAGIAYGAIKQFQDQVKDDGTLTQFRDNLGLTHQEMLRLSDGTETVSKGIKELTDVAPTFGDVMHGVFAEIAKEANQGGTWDKFKGHASDAFSGILDVWNKTSAALSAGLWTLGDIAKDVFQYIGQKIGQGFYDGVNKAIDALNGLNARIPKWAGGGDPNLIPHLKPGKPIKDLGSLGSLIQKQADQNYKDALAENAKAAAGIRSGAVQSAEDRMQREADALKGDRRPKKPKREPVDHADDIIARLDEQILSAKLKLAGTAEEQAALQLQQIDVEKNKTIADAKSLLSQHKITGIEEQHIEAAAKQLADLKAQAVLREEQTKLLTQQQAAQDQLFGFQTDALKFADQMATTQAEHRKAQLDMLDIEYRQKAYDLEILEAKQKLAHQWAEAALTQSQIDHLPIEKAMQQQLTLRKTMDPLQQWAQQVPHTADQITEALQSIEVKGLDGLASGITDVITGTKSLGAAFHDIANQIISDILQMTIKMLIFRALSSAFGGSMGIGGLFGASPSSLVPTSFTGGFDPAMLAAPLPHLAGGGSFIIGGNSGVDTNVLSLNGHPFAMVNQGEGLAVFPNSPTAANSNAPVNLTVNVDAKDAVLTQAVKGWIVEGIAEAAPHIASAGAASAIRNLKRPRLMAGR